MQRKEYQGHRTKKSANFGHRTTDYHERCTLPGCGSGNTEWKDANIMGALTTLIPKKVGEEKILESICPICLMNTAAKIVTSVWAKRLSKSLEQQSVLEGPQEGFRPDRSTRRQISRFISALQDVERNQGTMCVTFLDFENYFNTISLPALFLLLRKFGMNENDVKP